MDQLDLLHTWELEYIVTNEICEAITNQIFSVFYHPYFTKPNKNEYKLILEYLVKVSDYLNMYDAQKISNRGTMKEDSKQRLASLGNGH